CDLPPTDRAGAGGNRSSDKVSFRSAVTDMVRGRPTLLSALGSLYDSNGLETGPGGQRMAMRSRPRLSTTGGPTWTVMPPRCLCRGACRSGRSRPGRAIFRAEQVVRQQVRPDLLAHHLWRLAP